MGLFSFIMGNSEKSKKYISTIESIKYTVIRSEEEIKKIEKDYKQMIENRRQDPSYNYKVNGHIHLVSDADANRHYRNIKVAKKKLVADLAPLLERLNEECKDNSQSF